MAGFQLTLHGRIWVTPEAHCITAVGAGNDLKPQPDQNAIGRSMMIVLYPGR